MEEDNNSSWVGRMIKAVFQPLTTTSSLDMKDITHLMDMDGEGLCFNAAYEEETQEHSNDGKASGL